ncbi:hypothetical protein [Natronosalvus caseinilyticus]|uniref:hypothetical protein n=1 Tax=Natronosalvus caseinilyticus TaxID=2953747 RepID=UPI0028ADAB27|nr:hypothetical protein [Natronosalvus caseinilyticus]
MSDRKWFRGLWTFYLEYTRTGMHTATAAAFAIFALLVFVDSLFAVLAIGVYVVPPVLFYVLDRDLSIAGDVDENERELPRETVADSGVGNRTRGDGDTGSDSDSDTDSDGGDTDTDSDSDSDDGDTDTDSDSDDRDTDSDSDSDSDDGDTDSDFDTLPPE